MMAMAGDNNSFGGAPPPLSQPSAPGHQDPLSRGSMSALFAGLLPLHANNPMVMFLAAQLAPTFMEEWRSARRFFCAQAAVALRSIKDALKSARDRRSDAWTQQNDNNGRLICEVRLHDRVDQKCDAIRSLVWYMMQPGVATITRIESTGKGVHVPNNGVETKVSVPASASRHAHAHARPPSTHMMCTVWVTQASVSKPNAPAVTVDLMHASVRMAGVGADECMHIIEHDIVGLHAENCKGFDHSKLQVLTLTESSSTPVHADQLLFETQEFTSYKNWSNMFLSRRVREALDARLRIFHEPWMYERIGGQRSLSILLHGPPGTGKTAYIKVLANETQRHILRVNLKLIRTPKQLHDVFHPTHLTVLLEDGRDVSVCIPMNKRMYVFEEVDLQSPVVLKRAANDDEKKEVDPKNENKDDGKENVRTCMKCGGGRIDPFSRRCRYCHHKEQEPLALNHILELFDGLVERWGMLSLFTTNCRDSLDPALLRPGRMDIDLELGPMDADALHCMMAELLSLGISPSNDSEAAYVRALIDEDSLRARGLCGSMTPAEAYGALLHCLTYRSLGERAERVLALFSETVAQKRDKTATNATLTLTGKREREAQTEEEDVDEEAKNKRGRRT